MPLVPIDRIRADHRAQPRIITNTDLVARYVQEMAEGDEFPPIVVFQDGDEVFIGDGFHRFYAYQGLGLVEVECDVRPGGLRGAILHSCSANIHGVPRTNEDKRRAVTTLFNDPLVSIDPATGAVWSDRAIARICKVSDKTVARLRPVTAEIRSVRAYVTKHGTVSTMNTSRIGSTPLPRREPTVDRYEDHVPRASTPSAAHAIDVRPSPPSPATNPLFLEIENDRVHTPIDEIVRQFGRLPSPEDAVTAYPTLLRHCMSADLARQVSDWFARFAEGWANAYEAINVAAE